MDSMFGVRVPQGIPLRIGCCLHRLLPTGSLPGNKGLDAPRMGPSAERDYWSISLQPLSPFPGVPLLQAGDGPGGRLRRARQLP